MAECQHEFVYGADSILTLTGSLSRQRLRHFRRPQERIGSSTFDDYLWNARLSKAFRFPLEVAEIALRNRIAACLADRYGDWPRSREFRLQAHAKTLQKLETAFEIVGSGAPSDRIVENLTFGFWTRILAGRFVEALWRGRTTGAFPYLPKKIISRDFKAHVNHVRTTAEVVRSLRNDIAHLKPIHRDKELSQKHKTVVHLIQVCCKTTAQWVDQHSTVHRELRAGPKASSGTVLSKAWRGFRRLDSNATVSEVLAALDASERSYVLVTDGPELHLISASRAAKWIARRQEVGLVEIDVAARQLLEIETPTVLIPRSMTVWECRHKLSSAGPGVAAIITENGEFTEPLGIVEIGDLL